MIGQWQPLGWTVSDNEITFEYSIPSWCDPLDPRGLLVRMKWRTKNNDIGVVEVKVSDELWRRGFSPAMIDLVKRSLTERAKVSEGA